MTRPLFHHSHCPNHHRPHLARRRPRQCSLEYRPPHKNRPLLDSIPRHLPRRTLQPESRHQPSHHSYYRDHHKSQASPPVGRRRWSARSRRWSGHHDTDRSGPNHRLHRRPGCHYRPPRHSRYLGHRRPREPAHLALLRNGPRPLRRRPERQRRRTHRCLPGRLRPDQRTRPLRRRNHCRRHRTPRRWAPRQTHRPPHRLRRPSTLDHSDQANPTGSQRLRRGLLRPCGHHSRCRGCRRPRFRHWRSEIPGDHMTLWPPQNRG